jgi:hypothetical protein
MAYRTCQCLGFRLPWKHGDHHNPILLHFVEYSLGETPHSRAATTSVDVWKLQRMFRYRLDRGLNRQCETLPKPRTNVAIPCPCFQQIIIGFWNPNDRGPHCFLKRPALTCSQGMTFEGFCSCRAMR